MFTIKAGGSLMVAEFVAIHPFESVTATFTNPAHNDWGLSTPQFSVYEGVPPLIFKVAVPSQYP